MEKNDIIFLKCYSESVTFDIDNWANKPQKDALSIAYSKYDFINSYKVSIKYELKVHADHRVCFAVVTTDFVFYYEDFDEKTFYIKEHFLLVEMIVAAYNSSRMEFYNLYKHIKELDEVYLTHKTFSQLKEQLVKLDLYNK